MSAASVDLMEELSETTSFCWPQVSSNVVMDVKTRVKIVQALKTPYTGQVYGLTSYFTIISLLRGRLHQNIWTVVVSARLLHTHILAQMTS